MKWLDHIWWKGIHKPLVLAPSEDGSWRYLILEKDQNRVRSKAHGLLANDAAVVELLEKRAKLPILLCLWGAGVFERLLEAEYLDDPVAGVMGVSVESGDELATSLFAADGGGAWAAIVRREKIEEVKGRLGAHGKRVVQVVISKAVWAAWLPGLVSNSDLVRLDLDGHSFCFRNGLICAPEAFQGERFDVVSPTDFAEAAETPAEYLDLYAAAVALWLKPGQENEPGGALFEAHTQTSRLKNIATMGALALGLWACILFSLRIQGERRKAELEYSYSQNLPVISAIQSLDEKIAARQELKEQLGGSVLAPSKASYYMDRVAVHCPRDILLTRMTHHPEEADLKRAGAKDMENIHLLIQGESRASSAIAAFSEDLEKQPWVDLLKVLDSKVNFQTGAYLFTILIRVADV